MGDINTKKLAYDIINIFRKEIPSLFEAKNENIQPAKEIYVYIEEASDIIGLSKSFIYKNIETIPHLRRGKRYVFEKEKLLKYRESLYT